MRYPYFSVQQSSIVSNHALPYDESLSEAAKLLIQHEYTATPITRQEKKCHQHSEHPEYQEHPEHPEEEECYEEDYTVGYLLKKNSATLDNLRPGRARTHQWQPSPSSLQLPLLQLSAVQKKI